MSGTRVARAEEGLDTRYGRALLGISRDLDSPDRYTTVFLPT